MPDYGIATPLVNTIKRPFKKAGEMIDALPSPPQWFSSMVSPEPSDHRNTPDNTPFGLQVQAANKSFLDASQHPQVPNLSTMKKPLGK